MRRVFAAREDRGDGFDLRSLSHGGEPVNSRLYFAVRDEWWRTAPMTAVRHHHETTPSGFRTEIDAVTAWESHPAEVALRYVAEGPELLAEVTVTARGSFTYARIGFCLLFSMVDFGGLQATSWRGGASTDLRFPAEIVTRDRTDSASVRFHRPFDRLETELMSGTRLRYVFEGEDFEFEDQRNWSDASFKAYSIPPPEGSPSRAADGDRFTQRVRIRVDPADEAYAYGRDDRLIRVAGPVGTVPSIDLFRGRISPDSYRPDGGFHEFNTVPAATVGLPVHDSIELAVNGAVHAADDESVLDTTAVHGVMARQIRAAHPGLPLRLAPVSFLDVAGDWRDEDGNYAPEPPYGPPSPRRLGGFAATWAIASAARAVTAGPDMLRYFDPGQPDDSPGGRAVARLRALSGGEVLAVTAPPPLAVLAVSADDVVTLAVANTGPDPTWFRLPDGREAALEGFASDWFELPG